MFTVTGTIQDATGKPLHSMINFISKSTPLSSGGLVTNTDKLIRSHPSDGTFSIGLLAGTYQVIIAANGQSTILSIVVPSNSGAATIDSLATGLSTPPTGPNSLAFNGQLPGNIQFFPISSPQMPPVAISQVAFSGGNIGTLGGEKYAYCVSYMAASGQTSSSQLQTAEENEDPSPDLANRITLATPPPGVTSIRIWRSILPSLYNTASFPIGIGLLATVSPSTTFYDDPESATEFLARVTTDQAPFFNTTAGLLLSSNGTPCAYITDQGLYFPGTNCRIFAGFGLQIYNFETNLWYTVLMSENPSQMGLDDGNTTSPS